MANEKTSQEKTNKNKIPKDVTKKVTSKKSNENGDSGAITPSNENADKQFSENVIFQRWLDDTRIRQIAHIKSNNWYSKWHIAIGILLLVLSASVASTFFANAGPSIPIPNNNETTIDYTSIGKFEDFKNNPRYIVASILSILTTIVAAIQTILKLPEKAEQHHESSVQYGDLRRDLECFGIRIKRENLKPSDLEFKKLLQEINDRQIATDKKRPLIPQWIFDKAEKHVIEKPRKLFTSFNYELKPSEKAKCWFKRLIQKRKQRSGNQENPPKNDPQE